MTPDNFPNNMQPDDPHHRRWYPAPEWRPSGASVSVRTVVTIIVALMGFGALCACIGVFVVNYVARLESLERNLAAGGANAHPAQMAPVAAVPQAAAGQPQFYFMMGQQGGYPVAMPGFQGGVPFGAGYPYQAQTDINQFLLQKYRSEFEDYLKHSSSLRPPPPGTSWTSDAYVDSYPYASTPFAPSHIMVPSSVSSTLKQRFSKDEAVESWLIEKTAVNLDNAKRDVPPGVNAQDPDMADILRRLAETTFSDKQYDRTARIYAELAARKVNLSVGEMMRWAKAAELSGDVDSALRILGLVLQSSPDDQQALQESANLMVANQRFSEAAEMYKKLMQLQPGERKWRVGRAKTLTWSNRGKEAVELMRELYREDPSDIEFNTMLAELLLSEGHYEESLPILDTLIAARPEDASLKVRKLNALMALHRFKDAAELNEELVALFPADDDLLLKLAVNRVAGQDFAAAVAPFEEYLTRHPDDLDVRAQLAECLMAANAFPKAAEQFGILLEHDPENIAIKAKLANALMAANEFDAAVPVYMELIEARPEDPDIAMGFVVSLRMTNNTNQALVAATEYLSLRPNDRKMMLQAAEIGVEMEKYDLAAKWYRNALRLDAKDFETRVDLGYTLLWGQKFKEAESEFRKSLVYHPGDLQSRRGLARSLVFQRKFDEGFGLYEELVAEEIGEPTLEYEYGYYKAVFVGMENEASEQLRVLQDLDPDDVTWKGDRVQSLLRQHRFEEAGEQAEVVYAQKPDHRATYEGMRSMNRYLTTYPVQLRGGLLKKDGDRSDRPEEDHPANITYKYLGLHGEMSMGYNWRFNADVDHEWFNLRTPGVANVRSRRLMLGGKFEGHPTVTGWGAIGYRWMQSDNVKDQFLYNLRGEMREVGGQALRIGLFSARREHFDNYVNVYDNLYAVDVGGDVEYRVKKWDFNGFLKSSILTDSNYNLHAGFAPMYRLVETPMLLVRGGGNIEYEDWKYTKQTYFSPQEYYKGGVGVDGRYYICRDPEVWGTPNSYLDFGWSLYFDRFSSVGQKIFLGVHHDYSERLAMFARVDYTRESYYSEVKLFGGLEYKFGGCE